MALDYSIIGERLKKEQDLPKIDSRKFSRTTGCFCCILK